MTSRTYNNTINGQAHEYKNNGVRECGRVRDGDGEIASELLGDHTRTAKRHGRHRCENGLFCFIGVEREMLGRKRIAGAR